VDLENEVIVDKQDKKKRDGEDAEDELEEEVHATKHPVLLNQYPICLEHSLFLLFAEEGLP
jgi:hypothetical protein